MPEDLTQCPGYRIGARAGEVLAKEGYVLVHAEQFDEARGWLESRVEVFDWFFSESDDGYWIRFRDRA